jgi:hypothetical protein
MEGEGRGDFSKVEEDCEDNDGDMGEEEDDVRRRMYIPRQRRTAALKHT